MVGAGTAVDEGVLAALKKIPKVELHAHLNGSIRESTLMELAQTQGILDGDDTQFTMTPEDVQQGRTLANTFRHFDLIHRVTGSVAAIDRITREVVQDFAADGCVYLELRTTPRAEPATGMTKDMYVQTVLRAMDEAAAALDGAITVTLLLSINRARGIDAARDAVALADKYRNNGVVGIDFSGKPVAGDHVLYMDLLREAQGKGLPLAVHFAETQNVEESLALLALHPARLGHACFLEGGIKEAVLASGVPIEMCLTSNICTESVDEYENHHVVEFFLTHNHPLAICTDDMGVFRTTLSHEYALFMRAAGIGMDQVEQLVLRTADYIIASADAKQRLRARMQHILDNRSG